MNYSQEINNSIKNIWPNHSTKEISQALKISENTILNRANKMHLPPKKKKYSKEDDQFIIDNYGKISIQEMADRLGVTKNGVVCRAGKLPVRVKRKANKHGLISHRLYWIWRTIKARCYNPNHKSYKDYGGRGIVMCDGWLENFQRFYDWATSNGHSPELTIDRIDVNGNYCPENCRWTTMSEQANNTRVNVFLTAFGETKTLTQWYNDNRCKCSRPTINQRYRNAHKTGLTPEQIISLSPEEYLEIKRKKKGHK